MTTGCIPAGINQSESTIQKQHSNLFQVAAFIKSERPSRYPGLTIKYVRGADPIIKVLCSVKDSIRIIYTPFQLLDEDEEVAETLAIDKWNTDSVEEFLDTVMVRNEDIDISENLV